MHGVETPRVLVEVGQPLRPAAATPERARARRPGRRARPRRRASRRPPRSASPARARRLRARGPWPPPPRPQSRRRRSRRHRARRRPRAWAPTGRLPTSHPRSARVPYVLPRVSPPERARSRTRTARQPATSKARPPARSGHWHRVMRRRHPPERRRLRRSGARDRVRAPLRHRVL